jgi:hypothetical protein
MRKGFYRVEKKGTKWRRSKVIRAICISSFDCLCVSPMRVCVWIQTCIVPPI